MLALLKAADDPQPNIDTQTPVYDYCGNIIGYTAEYTQQEIETSAGNTPTVPNSPGFRAGGFITDGTTTAGSSNAVSGTTVINNFNNSGSNFLKFFILYRV